MTPTRRTRPALETEPASPAPFAAAIPPYPLATGWRWVVRLSLATSSFAFFGLGACVLSWIVLPVVWLCGAPLPARRRRCQRMVGHAFRIFHDYMRFWRLLDFDPLRPSPDGRLDLKADEQVIVVANHPTLVDTTAILACCPELICIVTPWFAKNPLLRPLLYWCGHIIAGNDSLDERIRVIDTASSRLADGHSLLIFPEGTRSPRNGLGQFHRGAFALATRCGLPLQPIGISVQPMVLSGSEKWHRLPACAAAYRLKSMAPISPEEYPSGRGAPEQLARLVREALACA